MVSFQNKKILAKMNNMNANELLQAQAHIWNHVYVFLNSMSLKCAIDLGIPDIIQNHGKPMTVIELVAALPMLNPAKACNIYSLMRVLVHSGFFARQKLGDVDAQEEVYVLTRASHLLLKNHPLSIAPFLKLALDPILANPSQFLGAWFQNDDPTPFHTAHGKSLWDYCSHDPQLNNLFNEGMASDSRLINSVLIDECKGIFEGMSSLVDVAGGTGTLGNSIADAFPHLECTVFDLPHVVAGLQDCGNLKYVGGSMFESIPAADAVLLKWILHDWKDDECLEILKRCKEAISGGEKEGRKVIIIDMVLMKNDKDAEASDLIETQLCFDMKMMSLFSGKERREEEWAKLFFGAGFSHYKITPIFGLRSLIEVYP